MRSLLLALTVCSIACGDNPAGPSPSSLASGLAPVFHLEGNSGDACLPADNFYPSWVVVVDDAGDRGMNLRATVQTIASADCTGPFQGTGPSLYAYGRETFEPRSTGSVSYLLDQHLGCGAGKYTLWDGPKEIGATRVKAGHDCTE